MLTIKNVHVEELARLFYSYREALSHDGSESQHANDAWEHTSASERRLMVAAIRLALLELAAPETDMQPTPKFCVTPGEAEWGC